MTERPPAGLPPVSRQTIAFVCGGLFALGLVLAGFLLYLLGEGLRSATALSRLPEELFGDVVWGPFLFVLFFASVYVAGQVNGAGARFGGSIAEFIPRAARMTWHWVSFGALALWIGAVFAFVHALLAPHAGVLAEIPPKFTHLAAGALSLVVLQLRAEVRQQRPAPSTLVRGAELDNAASIATALQRAQVPGPRTAWGGFEIPSAALRRFPHYAVIGISGSGKTNILRMLMNSELPDGRGGLRARALVYDPKREFLPMLTGMGIPIELVNIFQPFDSRSTAWDIAADVTSPALAHEIAVVLAPKEKNDHPYFREAAHQLAGGVMACFNSNAPGNWNLNDVLEALSTLERLKSVLASTPDGRDLVARYLTKSSDQTGDIISSIDTKYGIYRTIARLWARAPRRCSIKSWHEVTGVILLGTHAEYEAAFSAINRAIFKRASQIIIGRLGDDPPDHTWVFLDEARDAEELDGLRRLLTGGRSKGAHVVLGFQDLDGFREVYGERVADEIVGQCDNIAVLRLNSNKTQEWASQYFGEYEYYAESFGESFGQSAGTSTQRSLARRLAIMPQEFRLFPPTDPKSGLTGVFATPCLGAWKRTIPPEFVDRHRGTPASDPPFIERPISDQERVLWTDDDLARLRVAPAPPTPRGRLRTLDQP